MPLTVSSRRQIDIDDMSKTAEKIESNHTIFTPSDALSALLVQLTAKQRRAVPLIVSYDLQGKPLEALFDKANPDRICNRSLFQRVWKKKKVFMAALDLAKSEARAAATASVVVDTVQRLRQIAPLAADDLERQIIGDVHAVSALARVAGNAKRPVDERKAAIHSLSMLGTRAATDELLRLIDDADPDIRKEAAESIGRCAAGLDTQRRLADVAVLDRADRMTANKGGGALDPQDLSDDELERIAAGR